MRLSLPRLPIRYLRNAALFTLAAICLVQMPYSAVHLDLAHDMYVAWRFLHGEEIPWSGRPLGGVIHLGPVYYWLLALLIAVGRSWLGAMMLLGALASLKVPLAYLVGKELHSRRAGFLYAVGLIVPAWGTFEWLFPGHNLLTTPLTLAFLLCAARYHRRPRRAYLIGMASIFVLALHAHPTAAGLVWIGVAVVAWAWYKGYCRVRDVALAAAIAVIPFIPYVIWDAGQGFADIRSGANYLSDSQRTGHLSMMLPILQATAFGGTKYWFASLLGWAPKLADAATLLITLCGVLGFLASIGAIGRPRDRGVVLASLATVVTILVTTALIRGVTPYYMTVVLRTALTGLIAIGLASIGETLVARIARTLAVVIAVTSYATCVVASIEFQTHGDWPFNFYPLFNVTEAPQPTAPFFMLPSYAMADTGAFLCASQSPSAHGVLAQQLLHDYSMDMRLACGRSNVKLGGADAMREHWLGLSRASFERLGIEPTRYLGSMGIVAAHPVAFGEALIPQTSPIYPAYLPKATPPQEQHLQLSLGANAHLVISNVAFGFVPNPEVTVTIDGKVAFPAVEDSVARVYVCASCSASEVDVEIKSTDPGDVDIVTF